MPIVDNANQTAAPATAAPVLSPDEYAALLLDAYGSLLTTLSDLVDIMGAAEQYFVQAYRGHLSKHDALKARDACHGARVLLDTATPSLEELGILLHDTLLKGRG